MDLPLETRAWLLKLAAELEQAGAAALVAVGHHLPPDLQTLGFRINRALGALGHTLELAEPAAWQPDGTGSLANLTEAIGAGRVDTLLMLDVNPLYTAPADLEFKDVLREVPLRIHLGRHVDETAAYSHWHVPQAHAFDGWSDARAGRRHGERVAAADPAALWRADRARGAGDARRRAGPNALRGGPADLAGDPRRDRLRGAMGTGAACRLRPRHCRASRIGGTARRRGRAAGGRSSGLGSGLPARPLDPGRPLHTALAAGAAQAADEADLGQHRPRSARRSPPSASSGTATWSTLSAGVRILEVPIWVLPGQAAETITLYFGYGQQRIGGLGEGLGYDAYRLRRVDAPWRLEGVTLQAIREQAVLSTTQTHYTMAGHHLVRKSTPAAVRAGEPVTPPSLERSLYPDWPYTEESWGMPSARWSV